MFNLFSSGIYSEAWRRIQDGATILDVRTPSEFKSGHLESAVNIPYDEIAHRVKELGPDKEKSIVLYCAAGVRANIAQTTLKAMGYSNTFNGKKYSKLEKTKPRQ